MPDTAYHDEATLTDVLARYREGRHDPAVVTETFRQIWRTRAERLGRAVDVPPCPFTADELAALEAAGRSVSFLPLSLATQEDRPLLATVFPAMDDFSLLPDNSVTNDVDYAGWFDYETQIESPLNCVDEAELFALLEQRGHVLMSLNQFIVAAQDSRLLTGHYLDEAEGWSRTSSRSDGRLMAVRFDGKEPIGRNAKEVHREGCLVIGYDVSPLNSAGSLGARSMTRWSDVAPAGVVQPHKPVPAAPAVVDLDAEWERIVATYVRLGFHQLLGMTEEEYRASLPRFGRQPEAYRGRFDVPLLVETRIAWEDQAAPAGIYKSSFIKLAFEPIDDRHRVPDGPYAGWFAAWGQGFPDEISPTDAQAQLGADELGGNPNELIAMEISHPELNASGRYWEAIGSCLPPQTVGDLGATSKFTRYVATWRPRGVPEVACNLNPYAYTFFRPLVRGAEIVTSR